MAKAKGWIKAGRAYASELAQDPETRRGWAVAQARMRAFGGVAFDLPEPEPEADTSAVRRFISDLVKRFGTPAAGAIGLGLTLSEIEAFHAIRHTRAGRFLWEWDLWWHDLLTTAEAVEVLGLSAEAFDAHAVAGRFGQPVNVDNGPWWRWAELARYAIAAK